MGYLDLAEYADRLRPYIRRRATEDERRDQVQLVCVELRERLEELCKAVGRGLDVQRSGKEWNLEDVKRNSDKYII